MPKLTTNDHSVLEMALVGFELQRKRIEVAIAEIQAELGQGDSSRAISTATDSSATAATGKNRFSAAARKRMAAAQEKRWQLLKAKAPAKKTKPTVAAKRRKATVAAPARKRPVQVKAAKRVATKAVKPVSGAKKAAPKAKNNAAEGPRETGQMPGTPAPVATELSPATE